MKLSKIDDYENEKGRFILLGDTMTNGKVYCECHITWNEGNEPSKEDLTRMLDGIKNHLRASYEE